MTIDRQAKVFLVNDSNFSAFRRNGSFHYHGALQEHKAVRLTVPDSGKWHLALQPAGGTVHYSEPQILKKSTDEFIISSQPAGHFLG